MRLLGTLAAVAGITLGALFVVGCLAVGRAVQAAERWSRW